MFLYQIWSGLGRGYSEICLKAICVCRMLPQGLFLSEQLHISIILDMTNSQKWLLSYFWSVVAPAGAFFSEKWHISRILDMSNPQKMTFKLLLSVGRSRRGFFFWKMTHFYNFGHVKSSKSVFFVKNWIFEVIKCQKSGNRWPKKQKNNLLLPLRQPPSIYIYMFPSNV